MQYKKKIRIIRIFIHVLRFSPLMRKIVRFRLNYFCSQFLGICKVKTFKILFMSIDIIYTQCQLKISLAVQKMQKLGRCRNLNFHKNKQFSHEHRTNTDTDTLDIFNTKFGCLLERFILS